MKLGTQPIISISTDNEKELLDIVSLCDLLNLHNAENSTYYGYNIQKYVCIYEESKCYQITSMDSTILEWRTTAKEFIESNFL